MVRQDNTLATTVTVRAINLSIYLSSTSFHNISHKNLDSFSLRSLSLYITTQTEYNSMQDSVMIPYKILKIGRRGPRFLEHTEFGHFVPFFCRDWQA